MLNAGKFSARPTGAELGISGGGTNQIGIAFELLDGPDAGQSITAYRYFSDAAVKYALKDMRTCGWLGDDVGNLASIGADGNLVVQLVIEHEDFTNNEGETKTSAKVKWINSLSIGGVQMKSVMDAGQRATFAQRMKQTVRAFDAETAQDAKSSGATKPTTKPAARPAPASRTTSGPRSPEPPPFADNPVGPAPGDDEIRFHRDALQPAVTPPPPPRSPGPPSQGAGSGGHVGACDVRPLVWR